MSEAWALSPPRRDAMPWALLLDRMLGADDIIRLCGVCTELRSVPVDRFAMLLELLQRCRWHGPRQLMAWRQEGTDYRKLLRIARRTEAEMDFLAALPACCTVAGSFALHKFMVQEHAEGRSAGPGPPGTCEVVRLGPVSFAEWTPADIDIFVDADTSDDELVKRLVCSSLAPNLGCESASMKRDGLRYSLGAAQDFEGHVVYDESLASIKEFPKHQAVALAVSCQDSRKRERESFSQLDVRELEQALPELVGYPRAYDVVSSTMIQLTTPTRAPFAGLVPLEEGEAVPSEELVALAAAQGISRQTLAANAIVLQVNIIRISRRQVDAAANRQVPCVPLTPLEIVSGFDQHQCAIAMSVAPPRSCAPRANPRFEGSEEAMECARASLLRFTVHAFCSGVAQRDEAIIKVLRRVDRYLDRGFRMECPSHRATSSGGASSGNPSGTPPAHEAWLVGARVELHSLVSLPEHNGRSGTVIRGINAHGRLGIVVDGLLKPLGLKPANCKRLLGAPPPRHNSGPAAAKVLLQDPSFDASVLFELIAQSVRGWSTADFVALAQMRHTCSAWYVALAKVSRRLELPRAFSTLILDERHLLLMTDETDATVYDVLMARPCSTVHHGGVLARTEGHHLAALGPTSFVKASTMSTSADAKDTAVVELAGHNVTLTVYQIVSAQDVLGGLHLASAQVCRLPASRKGPLLCRAAGGRLLVACSDVLTIWNVDPSRLCIELVTQLVAPGCSPLSSPARDLGPGYYGSPEIWDLAALADEDTVVACYGQPGGSEGLPPNVYIWSLRTGTGTALALPDVEVCAPIFVHTTALLIDGWPTEPDPDLHDPPRSEAIGGEASGEQRGRKEALLMYEEGGCSNFELGAWTGHDGRYHRSGQFLEDVPRSMTSLSSHGLVAIAGDCGYVKLFSPSRCAFVAWPGEHTPRPAETATAIAMAAGDVLVVQYSIPHDGGVPHPSIVRKQEVDNKDVVLWQR